MMPNVMRRSHSTTRQIPAGLLQRCCAIYLIAAKDDFIRLGPITLVTIRTGHLALTLAALALPASAAAQSAVKLGGSYTADVLSAVSGDLDHGTEVVARADVWLDFKGPVIGLDAWPAHLDVMAVHGPDFSGRRVGPSRQ